MVEAESFRPMNLSLTFAYGDLQLVVETTATPEIDRDPEYMRREVHRLIEQMKLEIKERGLM